MPDFWGIIEILAKLSLYLGILTASGIVFSAVIFKINDYRKSVIVFGLIGLMATIISFSLRGAALTGDMSGMYDTEMLSLLWGTPVGTALMYRLIGLSILLLGLVMGHKGLYFSAIGGALAIWSFDHIGHVPDKDLTLLNLALFLHLLFAALWIGILTPLKRLALSANTLAVAAEVGHQFGKLASITVPVLIIVGLYMAYFLVGSWTALFTTAYGQALLIKVAVVAVLLGLAAVNKLRIIPGLQRGDANSAEHLVKAITWEWGAIILILAVTAILTSTLTLPT
jgi:putative copper resistance protein D